MSFSAHAKFVAKELEKMQKSDAMVAGRSRENSASPVDPSTVAERDELGRVAQAVCA